MHSTGSVTACQLFHLRNGHAVIVTLYRVLQRGCCHSKLNCLLGGLAGKQCVDQATAKAVAAAYTVNDVQMIRLGETIIFTVIPAQSLSLAEMEVRRVMATFSKPNLSISCLATDL